MCKRIIYRAEVFADSARSVSEMSRLESDHAERRVMQ